MVRILGGALTAAVSALTRIPAVQLAVQDEVSHFTLYQSPANADAWNDACVAPDGSVIRVQIPRGGSGFAQPFQHQRVTDPTQAAQWSSWTAFSGGTNNIFEDGGCCVGVAADGLTLWAFAQQGTGGNAVWQWKSTNSGVSWSGSPIAVISPPGGALTRGLATDAANGLWLLYDVLGGEDVGVCTWSPGGGVWSALTTWSLAPIASGAGLCAMKLGSLWTVIYSNSYALSSVTWDGAGSWTAQPDVASATSTAIGRFSPRLQLFNGLYQLICTEFDTGALTGTVYSYPRARQSSDLVHWSNGYILHPLSNQYGAALVFDPAPQTGSAGARVYAISMAAIYSAPGYVAAVNQRLVADPYILSYTRVDYGSSGAGSGGKPNTLEIILDNNKGQLNTLVCVTGVGAYWQPMSLNASLLLFEGYKDGGPPPTTVDTIQVGTYRVTEIEFLRSPEQNAIKLVAKDVSRDLDRECRWQQTYTQQSVAWLVAEVCARAGLLSYVVPVTTNTGQLVPAFLLRAGQTYRTALKELCATYGLWYICSQNESMLFFELSSADAPVWSYQPEVEIVSFATQDERANHVIVSGKPPVGGTSFALTEGETYDDSNAALVQREVLAHSIDQKLTSYTQTSARAASVLAEEQRAAIKHVVVLPVNPALQVYDVVTLTDYAAPQGSGQSGNFHIMQQEVQFNSQHAQYEQHLYLEAQ